MLNDYEKSFLKFCIYNYGGSYFLDGNILNIFVGNDKFKFNITDKKRFGNYTVYHLSTKRSADGNNYYHVQLKTWSMFYAFYICFTHDFNKRIGVQYNKTDWERFRKDAERNFATNDI